MKFFKSCNIFSLCLWDDVLDSAGSIFGPFLYLRADALAIGCLGFDLSELLVVKSSQGEIVFVKLSLLPVGSSLAYLLLKKETLGLKVIMLSDIHALHSALLTLKELL